MERKNVYAAIIGGGAAGIVCALRTAERHPDRPVALIESADRIGKKLLVTGNGRCNLTNRNADAARYYGDGSRELINILYKKYNSKAVLDFFDELGLKVHTDSEGRVYPLSNSAAAVLEVLRLKLEERGVDLLTDHRVTAVRQTKNGYEIRFADEIVIAERLVIATGGAADYKGGDAGSFPLLKTLPLRIAKPTPALCPVKVQSDVLKMLKGVRVNAEAILYHRGNEVRRTRGEVQFTPDALSGICIFDLSRAVNRGEGDEIVLRLLPDLSHPEIGNMIRERVQAFPDRTAAGVMTGLFHKSVNLALLKSAGIHPNTRADEIEKKQLMILADTIDAWRFAAIKRSDFKNAQVTAGGVKLGEIDLCTFETKKYPRLYIVGEALDIDGDCGGYNLQFAFASGLCAGDCL